MPPTKQERLLNLTSFLLRAHRPVPWEEIRERLVGYDDASESDATVLRRFERDKATLREMGIPLVFVPPDPPEPAGYRIHRRETFLPRLDLTPEETAVLAMVGRFSRAEMAEPVGAALSSALKKLQFDAPVPGDVQSTVEERYLFSPPEEEDDAEQRNLRVLTEAIVRNRTVRFTYYAIGADKTAKRAVDPYGVGFFDGRWYLVGRSHKRKAVRNFRIDRIQGDVRIAGTASVGPDFEPPADFHLEDHAGRPPWTFGERSLTRAVIRFDDVVSWMVKETLGPEDEWRDEGDAGVLTRPAANVDALLRWVLRFGPHAEVLGPPELRRRMIEALRGVRALYAGGKTRTDTDGHGPRNANPS